MDRERFRVAIQAAAAECAKRDAEWGLDDCMMFVADVDVACGLPDPAEGYRGTYRSYRDLVRLLGEGGVEAVAIAAAERLGWREVNPDKAQCGDRGIVITDRGPAAALCLGRLWVCRAPNDVALFPARTVSGALLVQRAWSID